MGPFVPVILSGGAGARLWPVSREALPKPFIRLPDGETLLLKTFRRALAATAKAPLVVTNREQFFLTRDEYARLGGGVAECDFLLEPVARNTAPAICAAAMHVARTHGEDAVMLVLAADHLIKDEAAFKDSAGQARKLAAEGWLVTFGIAPTRPETGYGYIEAGDGPEVKRFVEKRDAATAKEYVSSGRYFWNSGMFCFSARSVLEALRKHAPEVVSAVEAALKATDYKKAPAVLAEAEFAKAPDVSFDYAVMEKADRRAVVRAGFDWNDIGSWAALAELTGADAQGNRVSGQAVLIDAAHCFVQSERMVAAIGVVNLPTE